MIRPNNTHQETLTFALPFNSKLNPNNRWIKLAEKIPWDELSAVYHESLVPDFGSPAIPARVVIGALILKHMNNLSDEETIEQIRENPYYQYFLGYSGFTDRKAFAPSLFVEIRKRLGVDKLNRINTVFISYQDQEDETKGEDQEVNESFDPSSHVSSSVRQEGLEETPKKGMLILDATVAPADIKYPTDVDLLNRAREKTEELIDKLWVPGLGKVKPRTYRRVARKEYLSFAKLRNPSRQTIRKAVKKQLGYVHRNLGHIGKLLGEDIGFPFPLSFRSQRLLWIIQEVYRQQQIMYETRTHSIADRIVSLSQPHVRPIVRGKVRTKVEFGAKLSASVIDGSTYLDNIQWDAYNESQDLKPTVERYKERFGYYPESVNADKIYWNRNNRNYLKSLGIKLYGGKPLGRPKKDSLTPAEKKQHRLESRKRNWIEGKFGNGKRRFGLGLVMAKTRQTSESWIAMVIFVMNVARLWRDIFCAHYFLAYRTIKMHIQAGISALNRYLSFPKDRSDNPYTDCKLLFSEQFSRTTF